MRVVGNLEMQGTNGNYYGVGKDHFCMGYYNIAIAKANYQFKDEEISRIKDQLKPVLDDALRLKNKNENAELLLHIVATEKNK